MRKHQSPQWWGPPKNFADRKNERKISWLELFYDLVYVAAIGQLTHRIAVSPTWSTVGYSFLLFCMIFWSWVNGSQYYDLHGGDGIRTRLLTFWQMLGVAAVAITMPDVFGGNPAKLLLKYPGRWKLLHLKDIKNGVANDLTGGTPTINNVALGTGQIDYPAVLAAAKKIGIRHYFIEDESPNHAAQMPVTVAYLRGLKE
jgi:hypothetical protein